LEDFPPDDLCDMKYSLNNGRSWEPWQGWLRLGSLDPDAVKTVLLKGTIHSCASRDIVNFAEAYSSTMCLDQSGNRAVSVVKLWVC
jgi:hypothetical protein